MANNGVNATLPQRFLSFATAHGGDARTARQWWEEIERRHGEAHRRYHTLEHVAELLGLLPDADETVLAAVWFHDAVYDRRGANEERSADMAREALVDLQFPRTVVDRAAALILATKNHDPAGMSPAEQRFRDADLAILGSEPERYRRYAEAIRYEYSWVPDAVFEAGRKTVLLQFIGSPSIYATAEMRARFEEQARANIAWELSGWSPSP